ncbi:MAG: hypothetical protein WCI92_16120 [Bacteroidota bacterium]
MKILGYSERGIINSIIFNIGDKIHLVKDLVNLISFPNKIDIGDPDDYTILLEQSLSRFGDCDLIIIFTYNSSKRKTVLFLEAKVKTIQGKWSLDKHFESYNYLPVKKGNTSNLFSQLYLKRLLMEDYDPVQKSAIDKYNKVRKIGKNDIVHKAFSQFSDATDKFYIGIIPATDLEIHAFLGKHFKYSCPYYFVSWKSIHDFCILNNLSKVLEVFDHNKGQIY